MIVFGTVGCHLCDEARAIVIPIFQLNNIAFQEVDIAEDDALMNEYGVRIPVIKSDVTGNEIGWPFDVEKFVAWLEVN
ncbi:hypothetical protein TDB9533_03549 [Thalassocella blandensis]|nr:hypothetical protein TDB9533_03549 [Thalassocella blandensis]